MVRSAVEAGSGLVADPVRDLEVIIVDDGSTDETPEIARRLCAELPMVRHLRHETNLGYGAALRTGFLGARMPWVFYTDGDCQFDLGELPVVVGAMRERADAWIVSGYRCPRRDPWPRVMAGKVWTGIANALYGMRVRDVDGAFKLYPRALFDHIVMRSTGALIDAEVLARATALGCTIVQVPVTHRARRFGNATGLAPRTVWRGVREVAALTRDIWSGPMGRAGIGERGEAPQD